MLNADVILYGLVIETTAGIHVSGGKAYKTRMTMGEVEEAQKRIISSVGH